MSTIPWQHTTLLFGCTLAAGRHPGSILETAGQLKLPLLGNFGDQQIGYIGVPLATSDKEMAKALRISILPQSFAVPLDEVQVWLASFVGAEHLRQAEEQWTRLRSAHRRNVLVPGMPSALPTGKVFFVREVERVPKRYGSSDIMPL
jgi:hypothetical protein